MDGLIGPILLTAGWLIWASVQDNISTTWNDFVTSVNETPKQKITSDTEVRGASTTEPADTIASTENQKNESPNENSKDSILTMMKSVFIAMPQLKGNLIQVSKELKQVKEAVVNNTKDKFKGFIIDTAAWKTFTALAKVVIQLVSFLKTVFYLILGYFIWRLTKISQLVRAYYLFRGREIPSQIISALS